MSEYEVIDVVDGSLSYRFKVRTALVFILVLSVLVSSLYSIYFEISSFV